MPKSNLLRGKALSNTLELLKNNIQYAILAILVINLLYLSLYTNGKVDRLKEAQNRLESELLSLRSMIQKESTSLEESANVRYETLQKVYSLNVEQTKTISQIPADNASFKKWIKENHEESIKILETIQANLNSMKDEIKNLETKINNFGSTNKVSVPIPIKESVESISL